MAEAVKHCRGCGRDLPVGSFANDRNRGDGLPPRCRECVSAYSAEHYRRKTAVLGKTVRERGDVPPGHKRCPPCEETKPHSEWERNKTTSDGWAGYCRECRAQRDRASYFKREYGIAEAERDRMIAA